MPCCAIITCKTKSQTSSINRGGISFHRFPKETNVRERWIDTTGRENWIPTKFSTICSKHFKENDFIFKNSGNRYLKPGAIPTQEIVHISRTPEQKILSPSNTSTPKKIKLQNTISIKEALIQRQKLQIKRIQAKNRRLKIKIGKIEAILLYIQNEFGSKTEDTNILKNISEQTTVPATLKACMSSKECTVRRK